MDNHGVAIDEHAARDEAVRREGLLAELDELENVLSAIDSAVGMLTARAEPVLRGDTTMAVLHEAERDRDMAPESHAVLRVRPLTGEAKSIHDRLDHLHSRIHL